MTIKNEKTLCMLLNEYMKDLLEQDEKNFQRKRDEEKKGTWFSETFGIKAQFNHARCIVRKLETDIERNILT